MTQMLVKSLRNVPRVPDWEARYWAALVRETQRPFDWNGACCFGQQAAICEALLGANPFPREMRTYKTQIGAARFLKKLGFNSLESALESLFEPIAPAQARRGDIGLAQPGSRASQYTATIDGTCAVARHNSGLWHFPTLSLKRAFRVGC